MAFTRKFLEALGIDKEKIETIIEEHTAVTDALKADRDKYKADAEKLPQTEKELAEAKTAAFDADGTAWKEKYQKSTKDFEDYKTEQGKKETIAKKDAAYRKLLKEAGVSEKRHDAVMRLTDLSKVDLNDDGTIKNSAETLKSIKQEWSEYIGNVETQGAGTHTPPGGGNGGMTKADIMKVKDRNERQKLIAENYELFGYEKKE